MSKLRVYEYAKQMNMSSKEIITILNRLNIQVANHMSVMDSEMVSAVENFMADLKSRAAQNEQWKQPAEPAAERPAAQERTQGNTENRTSANQTPQNQTKDGSGQQTQNRPQGQVQGQLQGQGNRPSGGGQPKGNRPGQLQAGQRPLHAQQASAIVEDVLDDERTVNRDKIVKKPKQNPQATKDNRRPFNNQNQRNQKGGKGNQPRQQQSNLPKQPEGPKKIEIEGAVTVGELAKLIKREPSEIIKKLLFLGIMATINQEIDTDAIELVASDFGVEVVVKEPVDEEALDMLIEEADPAKLQERPPIVTIMGHVDHGKTTLLDAIRETNVTAQEAGGITQHIGAYQVEVSGKKITFLDTPGHEAFTTMRARGAQVTDITVLVVAADDGVMPQTVEAINHAKAANVPIIVAVNKMDKPDANPDRVRQELSEYGLISEEWGGDTIFVPLSAKQRTGLDQLLEMILLVAEMAELKADPTARPRGTVIEAELDKGRGPVATVLVQNGTMRVGDIVVAGTTFGRVRAMVNDKGRRVKEAGPSYPVEILGLNDVPSAGDLFVVYDDERKARSLAEKRIAKHRQEQLGVQSRVTLEDLYKQIQEGDVKELNVIIKADVQGSVEALTGSLEKIDIAGVRVKVIHKGVGAITESDILLASASNAIVIGFNVRPEPNAGRVAESEKVDVRLYRVIYNVIEELEAAMKGMLDPEYKEVIQGRAEIRQTFKVSKVGTIAGCYVTEGKVTRNSEVRVIRDGIVIYEGKLDTLKRFKDDAREVASGYECGITLENFNDIKEGDIIEAFVMEAVKV
ncbi:translation initiation factor IF-2 [Effusibacillus dendaii]|uniref:Translation initiation factor IF-2 n=2 Tax=Effusibacillus dendaii TaxID=2743772 RepID=A0A7I8D912_9BACL|nr:translation initiation factor IF-2 [Effusibacillus dendaii]